VTAVTPTGNVEPLDGAQVSVVGGVPPVTAAGGYGTGNAVPDGDVTETGAGHERDGAVTGGGVTIDGVGCTGGSEHAASNEIGNARRTARPKRQAVFTRPSTTVELGREKDQEGAA
jgi:hypothetical protein